MKNSIRMILLILGCVYTSIAFAMPAEILLIRHGEKLNDENSELSEIGWARARELPNMFTHPEFQLFGLPVALYAMAPHKPGASIRSIQTLSVLSEKINVPLNKNFTRDDIDKLVRDIKKNSSYYDGKRILICWQHGTLVELAKALGVRQKNLKWSDKQYDRVWSIRFSSDSKKIEFRDLPQRLLAIDSSY